MFVKAENQLASLTGKYSRLASESEETKKSLKNKMEALEAENCRLVDQLDEEKR